MDNHWFDENHPMTVGELRKRLEGLSDDMPVMGQDEGLYSPEGIVCEPLRIGPGRYPFVEVNDDKPGKLWFVL